MKKNAFLFGYGVQGKAIAQGLREEQLRFHVIESSQKNYTKAKDDGYLDVMLMDVTEDGDLERLDILKDDYIICVMEDEHLNVFLTLSLRALFPDSTIVAISDSIYTSQKLRMAGASKVIDLYQVSANRIHNILRKPVATKLLDGFIGRNDDISLKEMLIPPNSYIHEKMISDVDFEAFGVLLVGMIDVELSHKFVFITTVSNRKLDSGDTIVCIGEKSNLEKFEIDIGREKI